MFPLLFARWRHPKCNNNAISSTEKNCFYTQHTCLINRVFRSLVGIVHTMCMLCAQLPYILYVVTVGLDSRKQPTARCHQIFPTDPIRSQKEYSISPQMSTESSTPNNHSRDCCAAVSVTSRNVNDFVKNLLETNYISCNHNAKIY